MSFSNTHTRCCADDFVVTTKGSNVEFLIGLGVPLSTYSSPACHQNAPRQTVCLTPLVVCVASDEPVVSRGPFVMSTEAELQAAMRDYKEGRLVQPRSPKHAEL